MIHAIRFLNQRHNFLKFGYKTSGKVNMQNKMLFNMTKFQVSNMFKLNEPQHQAFQQFTTNIN